MFKRWKERREKKQLEKQIEIERLIINEIKKQIVPTIKIHERLIEAVISLIDHPGFFVGCNGLVERSYPYTDSYYFTPDEAEARGYYLHKLTGEGGSVWVRKKEAAPKND